LLRYRFRSSDNHKFDSPDPLRIETDDFVGILRDGELHVKPNQERQSLQNIKPIVENYLRSWELYHALEEGSQVFSFQFIGAPGYALSNILHARTLKSSVVHHEYPSCPPDTFVASPDARSLWFRFSQYQSGMEPLPGMAYFCLTVFTAAGGGDVGAAKKFNVSRKVLSEIRRLSSRKGGVQGGRKADAIEPLSVDDRVWLEEAIRQMIRRVAEEASGKVGRKITMKSVSKT
jgi:hypothetical protein